jgi:glyoxylase-like metal-dependent hydrolase (beta-lactamase superfamily II)
MKKITVLLALVCMSALSLELRAQNTGAVIAAATKALGADQVQSVQYSGTGNFYGFGQAVGPGQPWPRFTMTKYAMAVNLAMPALREELTRIDDEKEPRGGGAGGYNPATQQGGIRPIPFGPQSQMRQVTGRTEPNRIAIWMASPQGFLQAAAANNAKTASATVNGRNTTVVSFMVGRYPVSGVINDENLVEHVETQTYNNVLGNIVVEVDFSDYRDVGGIKFPMHIVQKQFGFPTLDLRVADVQPNGASNLTVAENQQGGGAPPRFEATSVAPGVWSIGSGGGEVSYLVEFNTYSVIVEAPGNDNQSAATMAEIKRLLPSKPLRYVINTHSHTDHMGGVRWYAAEGVTIITHELNKPYYEQIFKNSHSLNPDHLAQSGKTPVIETVGAKRVLTDGTRTLEIHHIAGNFHDPALIMAYLPKEKILIEADAYNPRPADAKPLPAPSPFTVNLFDNIRRLELDVAQVAYVHGGIEPVAVLRRAAGR